MKDRNGELFDNDEQGQLWFQLTVDDYLTMIGIKDIFDTTVLQGYFDIENWYQ